MSTAGVSGDAHLIEKKKKRKTKQKRDRARLLTYMKVCPKIHAFNFWSRHLIIHSYIFLNNYIVFHYQSELGNLITCT